MHGFNHTLLRLDFGEASKRRISLRYISVQIFATHNLQQFDREIWQPSSSTTTISQTHDRELCKLLVQSVTIYF